MGFYMPMLIGSKPPTGSGLVTGNLVGRYTAIDKTLGNLQTWVESSANLGTLGDTGSPYAQVTANTIGSHNGLIFSEGDTAYSASANLLALPTANSTCMMVCSMTGNVGNVPTDTETLVGIGSSSASQYEISFNRGGTNTMSFASCANTETAGKIVTTPTFTITNNFIVTCIHNGTTLSIQIGDGSVTTIATNANGLNATGATQGNVGYTYNFSQYGFGGTIYEMLFYNSALSSGDQLQNRSYFASTWGVGTT